MRNTNKSFAAITLVLFVWLGAVAAFWGTVGYIAVHFLKKFW